MSKFTFKHILDVIEAEVHTGKITGGLKAIRAHFLKEGPTRRKEFTSQIESFLAKHDSKLLERNRDRIQAAINEATIERNMATLKAPVMPTAVEPSPTRKMLSINCGDTAFCKSTGRLGTVISVDRYSRHPEKGLRCEVQFGRTIARAHESDLHLVGTANLNVSEGEAV